MTPATRTARTALACVGTNIRTHRGLTQQQLAELSGVGSKTISACETLGRITGLKVVQLLAIGVALGVTLNDLTSGADLQKREEA